MVDQELAAIMCRLAEAEEPLTLMVGPGGPQLVLADVEVVGAYDPNSTVDEIREDLAEIGEAGGRV